MADSTDNPLEAIVIAGYRFGIMDRVARNKLDVGSDSPESDDTEVWVDTGSETPGFYDPRYAILQVTGTQLTDGAVNTDETFGPKEYVLPGPTGYARDLVLTVDVGTGGSVTFDELDSDGNMVEILHDDSIESEIGVNVWYITEIGQGRFSVTQRILSLASPSERPPAAKIGDSEYYTVQSAIDAAAAGSTVKLMRNTQELVSSSKNIVIDLNGHKMFGTVSSTSGTMNISNGYVKKLEQRSTGMLTIENADIQDLEAYSSGTVRFNSGNIDLFSRAAGTGLFSTYGGYVGSAIIAGGRIIMYGGDAGIISASSSSICSMSGTAAPVHVMSLSTSGSGRFAIGGVNVVVDSIRVISGGNLRITNGKVGNLEAESSSTCELSGGKYKQKFETNITISSGKAWSNTGTDPDYPWEVL